ncbi:hypothetical protein K7B10_23265 [Streptomyces flavotricini]|uniref:Uncharacterized protein n=1 Tax=Streptomyces flavotricini TaxID=66888 RepID=A0ABS8E930_9ACTN|nr:hypothetical protein [Streptomyces flavotricini]MCC0097647.1 hypothetical protein [Streptomyces flavotricini]
MDRVVAAAAAGSLAAPRLRTALRGGVTSSDLSGGYWTATLATALAEHAKDKGRRCSG